MKRVILATAGVIAMASRTSSNPTSVQGFIRNTAPEHRGHGVDARARRATSPGDGHDGHNHMLNDQPRLFFAHFRANDAAEKATKGLRAALDKANVAKR